MIHENTRIYKGQRCPIVTFNFGPFKNRIYVKYRGNLVHVGNRKMIPVKQENGDKNNGTSRAGTSE